jgi:hypothetical protein
MFPGLMPVPAILVAGAVVGVGTGTPIGLLLTLTKVISTGGGGSVTGTPIGLLVTLTKEIPTGGGSTAGASAGLLLALTKAT